MKTALILITLIFAFCSIAAAQSPPAQEGSRVAAPPGWCQGCSDAQKQGIIAREESSRNTSGPSEAASSKPKPVTSNPGQYALFTTNFLVNNDSQKKIKQVRWETTLTNRETKETIQTFSFVTRKSIAPHKSAVLKQRLRVPLRKLMGRVVPASQTGPNASKPEVVEEYKLIEIEYKDGSLFRP